MINTIERCPEIGKMLVAQYLIVILGSTSNQNLEKKMKSQIIPSFFELAPENDITITYSSGNKIESMEDTLVFAPQLYRLQKSVLLTEPLQSLFNISKVKDEPEKQAKLEFQKLVGSKTMAP